jgi:hypothetical protein
MPRPPLPPFTLETARECKGRGRLEQLRPRPGSAGITEESVTSVTRPNFLRARPI